MRCIPTHFSQKPRYLKIRCRDASRLLLSLLILFVYFLALPSLLPSSIYLVAFYTCLCSSFLLSLRGVVQYIVFGKSLCADMDQYFRVVYPKPSCSWTTAFYSLVLPQTAAVSVRYPCPWSAEPDDHECSSRKDGVSDVCTESRDRSRSPSEPPGRLCRQYGLSQLKSVPSVGYLQLKDDEQHSRLGQPRVNQEFSESEKETERAQ